MVNVRLKPVIVHIRNVQVCNVLSTIVLAAPLMSDIAMLPDGSLRSPVGFAPHIYQ